MNPVLRGSNGRFRVKGVALKALIAGGAVGVQWLLLRHNPGAEKYATVANFGMAAVVGGLAFHNYGNQRSVAPAPAGLATPPTYLAATPVETLPISAGAPAGQLR